MTRLQVLKWRDIPRYVYVALSGGSDSIAVYNFLKNSGRGVHALFYHHGTENSEKAYQFLKDSGVKVATFGKLTTDVPKGVSLEEFWRNKRMEFFHSFAPSPVITGHNLDDVVETWIWGCSHGMPKLIPYRNKNVFRPFLLTKKEALRNWCESKGVKYIEDESNKDLRFSRNRIRHKVVPELLRVNPGLYKVLRKKLLERGT